MRCRSARLVSVALASLWFGGCVHVGQQQQEPWRLFTLSPLPENGAERVPSTKVSGPTHPALGLGPIHLPAYLDQDQVVTRISQNHLTLSDDDRWAEPLEDNFGQVLAHNLSVLLRIDRVRPYPWSARERPVYQLEIDVLSFETDDAGTAHLAARWFLRDVAGGQTTAEKETRLAVSGASTSAEKSVESLSRALGDFSVAIADEIRERVHPYGAQSSDGAGNRTLPTAAAHHSRLGP